MVQMILCLIWNGRSLLAFVQLFGVFEGWGERGRIKVVLPTSG